MKKIMDLFKLSCKKASELIDKKSVFSLSINENTQLFIHKTMCSACRTHEKQGKILDKLLKKYFQDTGKLNVTIKENLNDLKKSIVSKIQH